MVIVFYMHSAQIECRQADHCFVWLGTIVHVDMTHDIFKTHVEILDRVGYDIFKTYHGAIIEHLLSWTRHKQGARDSGACVVQRLLRPHA